MHTNSDELIQHLQAMHEEAEQVNMRFLITNKTTGFSVTHTVDLPEEHEQLAFDMLRGFFSDNYTIERIK